MVVRNGSGPVSLQRRLVAWRQFAAGKAGHSRAGSARASSECLGEALRGSHHHHHHHAVMLMELSLNPLLDQEFEGRHQVERVLNTETVVLDASAEGGEEEEEGECGFCLFMKGGGCKEEFVGWEKCVEQAEAEGGDVVERCHDATAALRRCMDKFPDYYEPILRAERAMAEDLEAFKASEASEPSPASPPPPAAEEEQGDNKKQAEPVVVKEKEDLAA
ncbi:hypothetical protein TRIUR3_20331 [Triticum urartu]|uniref:Uncharacterized protein n=1 Tax=Triticum urartu TaxID=4572 RepID=M7ZR00_TRIUA|nr:hypothetical protein TRIUR3_20331 [Triticum urartu]